MSRGLSNDMVTQVTANQLTPVILIKAEFDSGAVRFWTGIGSIDYNSEAYTGAGNLISISEIKEVNGVEAQGATFQLSGINASLISLALTEDYQGRPISVYYGCLDTNAALVADPILLFKGRMDVLQIDDTGSTTTLSMQAENRLIDLKRTKVRRYTPEDQKQQYPGDLGLDFVASLQEMEIVWGKSS